jgi:hypothetical protein
VTGCARWFGIAFALLVLVSIGCCALINSAELRRGFPHGIGYNRVLAFDTQSGFVEGCMFIAYELDEASATRLRQASDAGRLVRMHPPNGRNTYGSYRATSALHLN